MQQRLGGERGLPALHLRQLDRCCVQGVAEAVRQPPAIRRPRDVLDLGELAAVQLGQPWRVPGQVDQQQLVPMGGHRDLVGDRGRLQRDDLPDIEVRQPLHRCAAVRGEHRQALVLGLVTDRGDQPAPVRQPGEQAVPHAVRLAELSDRPLPVAQGERLAAGRHRQAAAVRAEPGAVQEGGGVHEAAVALGAGAAQPDLQALRLVVAGAQQVHVAGAVVRQGGAVGGQVARVVLLVVGVPA